MHLKQDTTIWMLVLLAGRLVRVWIRNIVHLILLQRMYHTLHTDVLHFPVRAVDGKQYLMLVMDEFTRYVFPALLVKKSEAGTHTLRIMKRAYVLHAVRESTRATTYAPLRRPSKVKPFQPASVRVTSKIDVKTWTGQTVRHQPRGVQWERILQVDGYEDRCSMLGHGNTLTITCTAPNRREREILAFEGQIE
jgi:hypothetical protein